MRAALRVALVVPQRFVGGVAIGAAGDPGTIYEGYKLAWGDDFAAIDIVGPSKTTGYLTNRGTMSMPGARSGATAPHYYVDPLHTGYNDSGRGVPPITDTLSIQGGTRLKLLTRAATSGEKAHFAPSSYAGGKPVICASSINTSRKIKFYVGTSGGEIIVEAKMRHTPKAGNPAGWHTGLWTTSGAPTVSSDNDEWDFNESNSQAAYFIRNVWTGGSFVSTSVAGPFDMFDGTDHRWTLVMSQTSANLYIDGVLSGTSNTNANSKGLPAYLVFTGVVYNAAFHTESFSESAWVADTDGAAVEIDDFRVWSKAALPHYKPLALASDVNVAYAGTTTVVLPPAANLWGDGGVTEYVQCVAGEVNDPTGDVLFLQFPTGVSYDSGTRTITVDWSASSTPPGRLMFTVDAYQATGSTCEPLTFQVNRGPKITIATQSWTNGSAISSLDVYAACNCGNLLPKTISVTNLPAGLSFSSSTGLVTGTPTAVSSGTFTVQVTNAVGQTLSSNISYSVASSWAISGALVDLDYQNDRAYVNGVEYASISASRTAGAVVQTGGIDRVAVSGFLTSSYTLAAKGITSATPISGATLRYLCCLDDGADGVSSDELVLLDQAFISSSARLSAGVFTGSVQQDPGGATFSSTTGAAASTACKIALRVAANNLGLSIGGGATITDNTATLPTVTQLVVGNRDDGTRAWGGTVKRVTLIGTAVSDANLPSIMP
jgi:hypothetical protein